MRSVSILAWTGPRGWLATHVSQQQVGSPSGSLVVQNPLPSSWGWQEPDQRFECHTNPLFSDKRTSPKGALWPFSLTSPHIFPFSVCFCSSSLCFCSFLLIHSSLLHRFRSSNQNKLFNFSLRISWALAERTRDVSTGMSPPFFVAGRQQARLVVLVESGFRAIHLLSSLGSQTVLRKK